MLRKKENKIRKMKQRIQAFEKTNPKLAENWRGRLASFMGKKS